MARILAEDITPPQSIACITFSNECVNELLRRLESLGIEPKDKVFLGTVHSFCYKHILLPFAKLAGIKLPDEIKVANDKDQSALIKLAVEDSGKNYRNADWKTLIGRYRLEEALNQPTSPSVDQQIIRTITISYINHLRQNNFIDYDDISLIGLSIVENHEWACKIICAKFPVLVVDEYQDLGKPLHRIVMHLFSYGRLRLLAVGDPDQSIYSVSGANAETINELKLLAGIQVISLRFNYRSSQNIIYAAEAALGVSREYKSIKSGTGLISLHYSPTGIHGQSRHICAHLVPEILERSPNISLGDIAVLYPTWYEGEIISQVAENHSIKFIRLDRGATYKRTPIIRWIEDCALWCTVGWATGRPKIKNLIHRLHVFLGYDGDNKDWDSSKLELISFLHQYKSENPYLRLWLHDILKGCLKNIKRNTRVFPDEIEALVKLWDSTSPGAKLSKHDLISFAGQGNSSDHIKLITLHSAKGLEFEVVILLGVDNGCIPSWRAKTIESQREQRRLFYVGMTRAKNEVHFSYSGFSENQKKLEFHNGPSVYLQEISLRLNNLDADILSTLSAQEFPDQTNSLTQEVSTKFQKKLPLKRFYIASIDSDINSNSEFSIKRLPFCGCVAAGYPKDKMDDDFELIDIAGNKFNNRDHLFILEIDGFSMKGDGLNPGDLIIVRKQETAQSGEMIVSMFSNGSANVKRFHLGNSGQISLISSNDEFPPIPVLKGNSFEIQGKVIGVIKK